MASNITEESLGVVESLINIGCALSVLGFIVNIVVLLIINRVVFIRKTTRWFIFNQSLIDATGCLLFFVLSLLPFSPFDCFYNRITLWFQSATFTLSTASSVNVLFISVERYFAIIKPFWFETNYTVKRTVIMMVSAWILGILCHPTMLIMLYKIITQNIQCDDDDGEEKEELARKITTNIIPVVCISTILILVLIYTRIIFELVKMKNNVSNQMTSSIHVKTLKVFIAVSTAYIVCFVPIIVFLYGDIFVSKGIRKYVAVDLVVLNFSLNPFIYTISLSQFRTEVINIFQTGCCKNRGEQGSTHLTLNNV
ncbi:histamine H2 receptor-like [Antedon mediterranea]|uniref:histamine H2 receptor-like n=1 Tax=Antedon mediterranea TaxID=105859 RepID=UPI003AF5FB4E